MTDTELIDRLELRCNANRQCLENVSFSLFSRRKNGRVEYSSGSDPRWYPSLREALSVRFSGRRWPTAHERDGDRDKEGE